MEIILLERHSKLGNIGDVVNVKNGYARNYLFPNKKALVADAANKEAFAARKIEIEKEFAKKTSEAEEVKSKIDSKVVILTKQAGKDGRLYGSVTSADIVSAISSDLSVDLPKSVVKLNHQIKVLGRHTVPLNIFSDVYTNVVVLVARSQEEAQQEIDNAGKIAEQDHKQEISDVEIEEQSENESLDQDDDFNGSNT